MKTIIKTKNEKLTVYSFFGIDLLRKITSKDHTGKKTRKYGFPLFTEFNKKQRAESREVFYLKVNRVCDYTFLCLQNWIDIVHSYNGNFYIICDKPELKKKICDRITFYDYDVKFITSSLPKNMKDFCRKVTVENWNKAAFAHTKTYQHAIENGFQNFWNIDADDTMFLIEPKKIANILKEVAVYAENNDISNFSYDMWRSRTNGKHWSFGVTYTRMNVDYREIFNNTEQNWDKVKIVGYVRNLDWLFTYFKNDGMMKNETWYSENTQFVHWGEFISNLFLPSFSLHKEGSVYYPLFLDILKNTEFGITKIYQDCIKFNFSVIEKESKDFFNKLLYQNKATIDYIRYAWFK